MRPKKMKRCAAALLCLLMLLCAGCAKQPENPVPSGNPAQTDDPTSGTTGQAEVRPDYHDAYAAYLGVLADNREAILGYDWQKGMVFDEEYYETLPAGVSAPVALADVWGDETPELLFLSALSHEGFRYAANLRVYTWDGTEAREICNIESLDGQAGGGMNYRLFQTEGDKGLWLYEVYYSDGEYETYTHYATEGNMEPQFTCAHSNYPVEDPSVEGGWGLADSWEKIGAECTQEAYEAAVPAEDAQAEGLLMRNLMYYEVYEDAEVPEGAYAYPEDGAALTYDAAVAYLRGELGVEPDAAVNERAFFSALPDFTFASGAGGWSTELSIDADGSFYGYYHDSDMGDSGEGYPYGTVYVCSFSGRFGNVTRVDDYTYTMRLLEMNVDPTPAEEWIEDEIRFVSSGPYGLENAKEVTVYLPGAWLRGLPMEFVTWVSMPSAWGADDRPVLLPCYGLYNAVDEQGFFGYGSDLSVTAQWAEDAPPTAYDEFTADTAEPTSRIVFSAQIAVRDFKVLRLTVEDVGETGMTFSAEELHAQDALTPERPLVVTTTFYGDTPNLGISYVDGDGTARSFAVDVSGRDGSLVLTEFGAAS